VRAGRLPRFSAPTSARQVLEERGFLPTLETREDGRVLREHNCPLVRLTAEHPEVCEVVHRWLESLLGVPVRRTQCLRQGHPHSEYHFPAS
jgi:predicted ArsR family transcriptional regulator